MDDDEVPIRKFRLECRGALKELLRRLLQSLDLSLQIVSGILRILKQIDDVSNAPFFGNHALGRRSNGAHSMLGVEEGESTDVTAVLKGCVEVP